MVRERNTLAAYVQHPTHHNVAPGQYTDDTQMILAIAEMLLRGDQWTEDNLADEFVRVFHRDPRYGYSSRFHAELRASMTGSQLRARITPGSDRSGAAMRTTPLGLLSDLDEVLARTRSQARVTHDSPAGIESAQAAALAVHYCHHRLGSTSDVARWVDQQLSGRGGRIRWDEPWVGEVGAQGEMSVRAALTALGESTSLSQLLTVCIAYTGDVDTVAAIALAAGSRADDITPDLSRHLYDTLENGPYGRDHLATLDRALLATYTD